MTRDEAEALLPFLANGTLEGAERAEVESIVMADPGLQADLAALRAIRSTLQQEQEYSPGELGLARLERSIDAETTHRRMRPLAWQIAAAVLLAVVVAQAAWQFRGPGTGDYRLAGAQTPAFTVAFRASATEAELRDLLQAAGVEIVSGPSALGLYGLAILDGETIDDARVRLENSDLVESLESVSEP